NAGATARNIDNEIIATYNGTGTLSAAGQGGSLSVTPTTITFSAGGWFGGATVTTADPAAALTATSGGLSASSNTFVVRANYISSFSWNQISPTLQQGGVPFGVTAMARDAYGNFATSFN